MVGKKLPRGPESGVSEQARKAGAVVMLSSGSRDSGLQAVRVRPLDPRALPSPTQFGAPAPPPASCRRSVMIIVTLPGGEAAQFGAWPRSAASRAFDPVAKRAQAGGGAQRAPPRVLSGLNQGGFGGRALRSELLGAQTQEATPEAARVRPRRAVGVRRRRRLGRKVASAPDQILAQNGPQEGNEAQIEFADAAATSGARTFYCL